MNHLYLVNSSIERLVVGKSSKHGAVESLGVGGCIVDYVHKCYDDSFGTSVVNKKPSRVHV